MPIPTPEPGLVIAYAYLWHHEHLAGADEGRKNRPVVVTLITRQEGGEAIEVTVLPITHRPPDIRALREGVRHARDIRNRKPMDPFRGRETSPGPGIDTVAEIDA